MALGLGLGLPFSAGRGAGIPQADKLLWYLDPRYGISASPVDAWASKRGAFSPTAAGALRPTWDGSSVDFDGTDDALTQAASAATSPNGATKFTIAGWCNPDSVATTVSLVETGSFPDGILLISFATGLSIYVGGNAAFWPGGALATGTWQFFAASFDGSRALGDRMRLYTGSTVALVTPTSDAVPVTAVPVGAGTALVGGRSTQFYNGKLGDWLLWSGVELTLAELQNVATRTAQ
jgi:hypothetical protein